MNHVQIYTDGACSPNPGRGGWAALLLYKGNRQLHEKMISGSSKNSTNNRMEIVAVIKGLQSLRMPCRVTVFSDSLLVVKCGAGKWRRRTNKDLWLSLDFVMSRHEVNFEWVRGHNEHTENERVDAEACRQRESI